MGELVEIADSLSYDPYAGSGQKKAQFKISSINFQSVSMGKSTLQSKDLSDSNYKYIPNNFKTKEGVAFNITSSKINMQGGLSGLYNMGNTCFFSTSKRSRIK